MVRSCTSPASIGIGRNTGEKASAAPIAVAAWTLCIAVAASMLCIAVTACGEGIVANGPRTNTLDAFAGGIVQVATIDGESASRVVAVAPDTGEIAALDWPVAVPRDNAGDPCRGRGDGMLWIGDASAGRLFANLRLDCKPGPYWIDPDGTVTVVDLDEEARPAAEGASVPFGHQSSPDGEQVLFAVGTHDVDGQPYEDLFVAPVSGGPPRQVTRLPPGIIPSFAWLPDGQTVVVAHRPGGGGDARLYRVNTVSLSISPVFDPRHVPSFATNDAAFAGPLAVAPDGQRLAFLVGGELWLLDLGDADAERVDVPEPRGAQAGVTAIAWAPDGPMLAYASDHDGACDEPAGDGDRARARPVACRSTLYLYSVEERRHRPLTATVQEAPLGITWAPPLAPPAGPPTASPSAPPAGPPSAPPAGPPSASPAGP